LQFKTGIEGLRGIAVLLVVMAHAGVPGLAGGFVGVDVFFVISGFLITGLLDEELRASGKIDYWHFYGRRARRLAPALLVMVALVSVAAMALIPAPLPEAQLASAFWALLWLANMYFAFSSSDYFAESASGSLFLHTWSLGVEEQFYLLWPWLLAWLWKRNGGTSRSLAALTVLGFLACLAMLSVDPAATYYLMPARLWQLAAGGLTWRLMSAGRIPSHGAWPSLFALSGLALVALGLWRIDGSRPYPGWEALLPVLGSMCLLTAGFSGRGAAALLDSPLLRLPGRISYSWYLWHWPFLVLLPAMGFGRPTASIALVLVLASFLVAWASHAWVEQPFRRNRVRGRQVVLVAVLASVILASALHVSAALLANPEGTGDDSLAGRVQAQISIPGIYGRPGCDEWYLSDQLVPCELEGWPADEGLMVFVGDSVGAQWLPAIERVARAWRYRLVVLTKSSCPMVDEPFFYARINRRFTECETWRERVFRHVVHLSPEIVIIGSSHYPFSEQQWREGSQRVLRRLGGDGRAVVVMAPTPMLPYHVPRCVAARGRHVDGRLSAPACSADLADVDPAAITSALRQAAADAPGSALLYMNDVVCPRGTCQGTVDGRLTYRDEQHLNGTYVEDLAEEFEHRLKAAMDAARNR